MPLKDTAAFLYMQDLDGNLFRIPADKVKVFLENQEQEKQLEENRERAEQHMEQEAKDEGKEFVPIAKKKSVGMDI